MSPTKVTVILDRPIPLYGTTGVVQRVTGVVDANSNDTSSIAMDVDGKRVILYRPFIVAVVAEDGDIDEAARKAISSGAA